MSDFVNLAKPGISEIPVYEPGRPVEEVARELGFEDVMSIAKLASNENSLGPSSKAVEEMKIMAGAMNKYPDGGAYYLRRAIASVCDVDFEMVLPGNGSNEILELIGQVFLDGSSSVVSSQYAFVVYRMVAAKFGAEYREVPARDFGHDLDSMREAITGDTRVVFVSNPNNPTGTFLDADVIYRFMERIPDDVIVCFDEAYIEMVEPEKQPDTLRFVKDSKNVIVLRTFSKAYGLAGLRLGYAIAPVECIGLMNRVRQPFNVNAMAMAAGVAALEDIDHVKKTRQMVRDGYYLMTGRFSDLGLEYVDSRANFVLVKVGEGRKVFEAMQKRGVVVRPMDGYGLPDYIRITIGTREENEKCLGALEDVLQGPAKAETGIEKEDRQA
ncbi:MAG: histidinol-phosphate transaminase [Verrucomicrobiota bacterium]